MRPRNFEKKKKSTASEIRFKEILDRFKEQPNLIYFHKETVKSMVTEMACGPRYSYALEFPVRFATAHGGMFRERVTFERSNDHRKWLMKVSVKKPTPSSPEVRVYVYGFGGWKDFALENNIKVGDLLIFTLIEMSRFVVYIYPKQPVGIPVVHTDRDVIQRAFKDSTDWTPNETKCQACGQTAPCPQFEATVSLPPMAVDAGFWVRHREMLPTNVIQLRGPFEAITKVEVGKYCGETGTKYQLESGWSEFAVANLLNTGDTLVFSLVGPGRFRVEVLEYCD